MAKILSDFHVPSLMLTANYHNTMKKPIRVKKLRLKLAQNHTTVKIWTQDFSLHLFKHTQPIEKEHEWMKIWVQSGLNSFIFMYDDIRKAQEPQMYLDTL